MKKELFYFPNWVIVDYLSRVDTDQLQKTDNLEMVCSVAMSKFCEKQFEEECLIGFEVKDGYKHKLPKKGEITIKEFVDLIEEGFLKDTPIDFSIAAPKKEGRMDFQLKRFGKSSKENNTDDLINYINNLSTKYGETGCNLIILCESCQVNPLLVSKKISTEKYPFKKIILLDVEGADYINFSGIWSDGGESGTSRFNINTMNFDY